MRILLCSHWFAPSVGGVETISWILAEEFVRAGSTVVVVTDTAGHNRDAPCSVVRSPSRKELRLLAQQSDVILQNLISLRTLVSFIPTRKPIVITHQSWLRRTDGSRGIENYMKLIALRPFQNVSISKAIADSLPVESVIIGNPFEAKVFEGLRQTPREKDIVFLGRLVSDKGCNLLLESLAELRSRQMCPSLTIIGDGPEMSALKSQVTRLNLWDQVEFLGSLQASRASIVARHRIMVVPSIWAEPFGVVALEGIASGCAIAASSQGGLPDAVGPCGLFFENGDVSGLTNALQRLLCEPTLRAQLISAGPKHLEQFQQGVVAGRYLDLFQKLLCSQSVC